MAKKKIALNIVKNNKDNFASDFINFYTDFLCGYSKAIDKLGDIQKNYKKEYVDFKNSQKDPSALMRMVENLNDKQKIILFEIIAQSATLSHKTAIMMELSSEEQKQLAKDLESFAKYLGEKLKQVKQDAE